MSRKVTCPVGNHTYEIPEHMADYYRAHNWFCDAHQGCGATASPEAVLHEHEVQSERGGAGRDIALSLFVPGYAPFAIAKGLFRRR